MYAIRTYYTNGEIREQQMPDLRCAYFMAGVLALTESAESTDVVNTETGEVLSTFHNRELKVDFEEEAE